MDKLRFNDAYIYITSHGLLNIKDGKYDIIDLSENNVDIDVNMVTIGELGTVTFNCPFWSDFHFSDDINSFSKMVNIYLDSYIKHQNGYEFIHKLNESTVWPWLAYPNAKEMHKKYHQEYYEILNKTPKDEIENKLSSLNHRIAQEKVSMKREFEQPSQLDTIYCRVFTYSKNDKTNKKNTENIMQYSENSGIIRTQIDSYKDKFIERRLIFSDSDSDSELDSKCGIKLMKYNGYDEELKKLENSNIFETISKAYKSSKTLLLSNIIEYFNNKRCNVNIILITCMGYSESLDVHKRLTLKRSYHNDAWGGTKKNRKRKKRVKKMFFR